MKDTAKSSSVDVEAVQGKEKQTVTEKCGNIEEKVKRNHLNMQSKPRIPTEDSEDQGDEKDSNIDDLSSQISGLQIKTENNLSDEKLNNLGGKDGESEKECNSPEADGDDEILMERGPTHGVAINQHPLTASIGRKHFPMPQIQNFPDYSNYPQPVAYAMTKGKRVLDPGVDDPYKYMRPPTDMMMPPSYPQQYPMTSTPYNITGPPAYQAPQMTQGYQQPQFGILPEPQPQMTSELLVTGSANMAGGKVVVNSPGAGNGPPSFPGVSDPKFVDDFLESIDQGQLDLTNINSENIFGDNCSQSTRLPTSHSQPMGVQPCLTQPMGTQVGLSQPMGVQMSSAQQMGVHSLAQSNQLSQNLPMTTILPQQTSDKMRKFSGPKFQNRRASDLDSGTESAGEQSPYSEQAPSPANSTYTSPPSNPPSNMSDDSGFGKSPPYDPFSPAPDNRCPSNMSAGIMSPDNRGSYGSQMSAAGSPPKYINSPPAAGYRASPSPPSQSCFSPQARIFPSESAGGFQNKVTSPVTSPMSVTEEPGSEFINSHLDQFLDVLDVVAKDIKATHEKKVKQRPIQGEPTNATQMAVDPALMGKQTVAPAPAPIVPQLPKMIPQQQQGMMKLPVKPPATTNQVIILNPQPQAAQPVTTSNAVVIIPAPGVQPIPSSTLLVVSGQPQPKVSPKPQSKFREIRPKLPTNGMGPGDGSSNGSPSTKRGPAKNCNQNMAGQNAQAQQAQIQQSKLINYARRTVADIPREGLMASDEEGDTYLHIAVCKTDRYMVQALLERLHRENLMAMIDQENKKRQTPLFLAVAINQPIMVALFNKFRANVNVLAQNLSSDGQTTEVKAAIHVAAVQGSESSRTIQELLKAQDILVNIVNNDGQTALHCAILAHGKPKPHNSEGRIDSTLIIQALIKAGADASAQDKKSGKTPLMYAIEQKDVKLVETILLAVEAAKAKNIVRTQAFDGRSCLKIAEGLESEFPQQTYNRMWDMLQNAANGNVSRIRQY